MSEGGEFALFFGLGGVGTMLMIGLWPIFKAYAKRISHGYEGGVAELESRVIELETRLAALEDRGPRTGETVVPAERLRELEDRVDFAERMLTRADDPARLGRQP